MAGEEVPDARHEESQSPPGGVPTAFPPLQSPLDNSTLVTNRVPAAPVPNRKARGGLKGLARRNLVAAGAGALLAAVLGTVVTLGATSDNDPNSPSTKVGPNPSASQGLDDGSLGADVPKNGDEGDTGEATSRPTDPGPDGTYGTSDDPTPTDTAEPSDDPSGTKGTSSSPSKTPTTKPPTSTSKPPTSSTPTTSPTPTETETSESPTPTTTPTPTDEPSTTDSASGPASSSAPASTSASAPESSDAGSPSTSGSASDAVI